jgi:pyruvate dehydrogenase E1 component
VRGRRYEVLGADGFGRSDYRVKLRRFFEVDRHHVAIGALRALADEGTVDRATVGQAIERYGVDPDTPPPWTV